ncbi:NADPH-cytochrome P450 reductase, partial [Coemansia nantahalensis]
AAVELCPRLQARLYSISSSGKVCSERPTITAVVLQYDAKSERAACAKMGPRRCGVATNYLLGVLRYLRGDSALDLAAASSGSPLRTGHLLSATGASAAPTDASSVAAAVDAKAHVQQSFTLQPHAGDAAASAPRALTMPVFIRKSTFRLPADNATPIIMIGPGTGLAPMRAFVQERAQAARDAPDEPLGTTLLFFGARTEAHDYMYRDELHELFADIRAVAPESQLITAFSRDQPQKIYVQHRLAEHADLVYRTLLGGQQRLGGPPRAHVYVCGDAKSMAKDVARALTALIAEREGVEDTVAAKWVSEMRRLSRYQEDVWS